MPKARLSAGATRSCGVDFVIEWMSSRHAVSCVSEKRKNSVVVNNMMSYCTIIGL